MMSSKLHSAILILAVGCLVSLATRAPGDLAVDGERLVDDGKPVFLKGAMYYQPHAYWGYAFQDLDEKMVPDDMALMKKQGFTMVEFQVNWGDIVKRVDVETGESVIDEEGIRRLRLLITEARKQGLYVGLWFQTHRTPYGLRPAPEEYGTTTDLGGFEHQEGPGSLTPGLNGAAVDESPLWTAFLDWFTIVARRIKDLDGFYYDPLDWQMLNPNYWGWAQENYLAAWRRYLRSTNSSLEYWNELFGEDNKTWDEVLLPVDEWAEKTICKADNTPYYRRKRESYGGPKWRQWRKWNRVQAGPVAVRRLAYGACGHSGRGLRPGRLLPQCRRRGPLGSTHWKRHQTCQGTHQR